MQPPSTEEAEKIRALRNALGSAAPTWADDACLRRYLTARKWDLKQSEEMIRESIKWRAATQPEKITYEEVKPVLDLKTLYLNGRDRQGRPIVYVKPGAQNPFPPDKRLRALLFILETAISPAVMPPGVEQLVWVLDFSEYSFRGSTPESKQVSKQSMELLQNHYPERLGLSLVVHPGVLFSILFTLVSPFMNAVTRSKIYVLNGSGNKLKKGMLEYIAEEQLETQYGGTNPNGYTPPPAAAAATGAAAANAPTDASAAAPPAASTPVVLSEEQKEEKRTKAYLNMDVD